MTATTGHAEVRTYFAEVAESSGTNFESLADAVEAVGDDVVVFDELHCFADREAAGKQCPPMAWDRHRSEQQITTHPASRTAATRPSRPPQPLLRSATRRQLGRDLHSSSKLAEGLPH